MPGASSGSCSRSPAASVDEQGQSIGWNITKRTLRGMIDSALGLDPEDRSEEAAAKRRLRGLADLDGITFVARISVEPSRNPATPTGTGSTVRCCRTSPNGARSWTARRCRPKPTRARRRRGARAADAAGLGGSRRPARRSARPRCAGRARADAQPRRRPPLGHGKPAGPAWLN